MPFDPILMFIGSAFLAIVAVVVILSRVLSSARFVGAFAGGSDAHERIDSSTYTGSAFSDLNSFVPGSSSSSDSDSGSSDSSDSGGDSSD